MARAKSLVDLKIAEKPALAGVEATAATPQISWDILRTLKVWDLGNEFTVDAIRLDFSWTISNLFHKDVYQQAKETGIETELAKFAAKARSLYEDQLLLQQSIPAAESYLLQLKASLERKGEVIKEIERDPAGSSRRGLNLANAYTDYEQIEEDIRGAELSVRLLKNRALQYEALDAFIQQSIKDLENQHDSWFAKQKFTKSWFIDRVAQIKKALKDARTDSMGSWAVEKSAASNLGKNVDEALAMADQFAEGSDADGAKFEKLLDSARPHLQEILRQAAQDKTDYNVLRWMKFTFGGAYGWGYSDRSGSDVTQIEKGGVFDLENWKHSARGETCPPGRARSRTPSNGT